MWEQKCPHLVFFCNKINPFRRTLFTLNQFKVNLDLFKKFFWKFQVASMVKGIFSVVKFVKVSFLQLNIFSTTFNLNDAIRRFGNKSALTKTFSDSVSKNKCNSKFEPSMMSLKNENTTLTSLWWRYLIKTNISKKSWRYAKFGVPISFGLIRGHLTLPRVKYFEQIFPCKTGLRQIYTVSVFRPLLSVFASFWKSMRFFIRIFVCSYPH